jgi:hypothetical protein
VYFVKSSVEVSGGVTLPEGADHGSVIAAFLQLSAEALAVEVITETAGRTFDFWLCRRAAMANNPCLNAETTRVESRAGREAGGIWSIAAVKDDTFISDLIDGGTRVTVVTVAAEMIRALAVYINVENTHGWFDIVYS